MQDRLEEAIAKTREIIAKAQRDLEVLEQAAALAANLNGQAFVGPRLVRPPKPGRPIGQVDPNSGPSLARKVLRDKGTEMHIDDIIAEIKSSTGKVFQKDALGSTLAKLAKRGKAFYKSSKAKATFGLLEFRDRAGGRH